jgi:hypothetical protein
MDFLTRVTRELTNLHSTEALLMRLAALRIGWSRSIVFKFLAYSIAECNSTHGNLTGSVSMKLVENSVHRFNRSILLGIADSPNAMRGRSVKVVHNNVVFVEKLSLEGLVVNVTKSWCEHHLSGVAGKYTVQ